MRDSVTGNSETTLAGSLLIFLGRLLDHTDGMSKYATYVAILSAVWSFASHRGELRNCHVGIIQQAVSLRAASSWQNNNVTAPCGCNGGWHDAGELAVRPTRAFVET